MKLPEKLTSILGDICDGDTQEIFIYVDDEQENLSEKLIECYNKYPILRKSHDELLTACKGFMVAWVQPTTRSMHNLKTDMDKAYQITDQAIKNADEVEK